MRGEVDLSERALAYQATDGVVANSTEVAAAEFAVGSCELQSTRQRKAEGSGQVLLEQLAVRVCEFGLLVVELGLGSRGGWHTHTFDECACLSRNTPVDCLCAVLYKAIPSNIRIPSLAALEGWRLLSIINAGPAGRGWNGRLRTLGHRLVVVCRR